jgi:chemotaxis-related protein WspB
VLFVVFQIAESRYAIAGEHVTEVLPAVVWTPVAGAAAGVIGIVNYHGAPVPLVDARALHGDNAGTLFVREEQTGSQPSASNTQLRLHNRILVIRPREAVTDALVGVLVDRVLGTVQRDVHEFIERRKVARGASYLGSVLIDPTGIIQRIEPSHILPESVRDEVVREWSGAA